jgi:uncharacterized protein YdhG (YjbR/CyaY superfamily)
MAKTDFQSVDEYLAAHSKEVQAILQRVRRAIRKAVPEAEEGISYQIPAYKLDGTAVLHFAGWKDHYSLYPATGTLVEALGDDVGKYVVSKGTIRFPLRDPVPVKLIERIASFRAKETLAFQAKKRQRPKAQAARRPAAKKRPEPRT